MLSKPNLFRMAAACLLIAGLIACGGGGSSGKNNTIEISGTAEAPGGAVAMLEDRGVLYALGNFLVPAAGAVITGLQPVAGATVELIYIDDAGEQVGDVLASTVTSITGDYQLNLPEGVDFAANLVVRITGLNSVTLDAQVVTQTVDINPITDYVLTKLINNGTTLGTLAVNEVIALVGHAEEYDLTAGFDMADMLTALDAEVGPFLDNSITSINAGAGDGAAVAGDYHTGDLTLQLTDDDAHDWGVFQASVNIGSLTLVNNGSSQLTANLSGDDVLVGWSGLRFSGDGAGYLYHDTELGEAGSRDGNVDGSGALNFVGEFEESLDIDYGFGWRYPPIATRAIPVASTGVFINQSQDSGARYDLIDTNNDNIDDALDPNAKVGDVAERGIFILARKSVDADDSVLDGDYGMVGIGTSMSHGSGDVVTGGFFSKGSFSGGGVLAGTLYDGVLISRSPDTAPVESSDSAVQDSTYTVAADGSLTMTTDSLMDKGFVADGGNAFYLFVEQLIDDAGDPPTIFNAQYGMVAGVKLPASQPDMTGRSYRLFTLALIYEDTGTRMETISGGNLTFNDNDSVDMSGDMFRSVQRASDTADIEPLVEAFDLAVDNQAVTVDSAGGIDIAAIDIAAADGSLKLDGYVSADGNLLILRGDYDGDTGAEGVAMLIGVINP